MSLLKLLPGCHPYMWWAVVEWVMLLFYGHSENSSLPLSKFQSPFLWESVLRYTTILLKGFIIVMLFREDFLLLKDYSNSAFWYFPCFVEQDSNKLALGCRAKLVAYSQPMHKCILIIYLCVLLIYVDLWFLEVQYVGEFFVCLFLLQGRVKKGNSAWQWHNVQQCVKSAFGTVCRWERHLVHSFYFFTHFVFSASILSSPSWQKVT